MRPFVWVALFLFIANALVAAEVIYSIWRIRRTHVLNVARGKHKVLLLKWFLAIWILFSVGAAYAVARYYEQQEALKWMVS